MGRKERILVVDDEEIVRVQIARVLTRAGYDVEAVGSGGEALARMARKRFDVVLSDIVMEGMDGLELLKEVRHRHPGTVFMLITGHASLSTAIASLRLGAFDYLLKPCDNDELRERVAAGLKERRLRRRVEEQARRLERMAITDALTGLYTRAYFMEAMRREFKHLLRYGSALSFLMIDIDRFKGINDRYGHPAGDEVLRKFGAKLRGIVRETDIPGRYGGEEFSILLPRTSGEGARITAERLRVSVEQDRSLCTPSSAPPERITVSIGVASCPHPEIRSPEDLVEAADQALYEAKRAGRNRVVLFGRGGRGAAGEGQGAASP